MTYLIQHQISEDEALRNRVTACAAFEGVENPAAWAFERRWELSAQPGWAESYRGSSAELPGADESAVTDAMILDGVRRIVATSSSTE